MIDYLIILISTPAHCLSNESSLRFLDIPCLRQRCQVDRIFHEVLPRALGFFHLSVRVLGCDAFTSSILPTEVLCGALRSLSGSESASFPTLMNASTSSSRSRRLSVSGASTIIASSTIWGKYTVGE